MRGPTQQGAETKEAILGRAVDIASVYGLEGLTLGSLATELGMSKSGLYAHFRSKEALQLDTLQKARDIALEEVVRPAFAQTRGLPRLWALATSYLSFVEREVLRGGCVVAGSVAEWDARTGPVHDAVATLIGSWRNLLVRATQQAIAAGHLTEAADPDQLAFEICALLQGANYQFQLHRDRTDLARAARAIQDRLRPWTSVGAPPLEPWIKRVSTRKHGRAS